MKDALSTLGVMSPSQLSDAQLRKFVDLMSAEKIDDNWNQAFNELRREIKE